MTFNKIYRVHFSAAGTTKKILEAFCEGVSAGQIVDIDLLRSPLQSGLRIEPDDLAAVGMPVFAGRVPGFCAKMLKNIKGTNTPAAAIVAYGNRDYEDALLELGDILEGGGFSVIGSAAFVTQHSIFPSVGKGRPDNADIKSVLEFAAKIAAMRELPKERAAVPGNRPYRDYASVPFSPSSDKNCDSCGICARICPASAIDNNNPRLTDKKRCVACTACIYACPKNARAFNGVKYKIGKKIFEKNFSAGKTPEMFV